MALLLGLAAQTKAKGALDRTAYGEARHSPQDFVTHHVAAISAAMHAERARRHTRHPQRRRDPPILPLHVRFNKVEARYKTGPRLDTYS